MKVFMNSRISSCNSQIRWQHSSHICVEKIHNVFPKKERQDGIIDIEHGD